MFFFEVMLLSCLRSGRRTVMDSYGQCGTFKIWIFQDFSEYIFFQCFKAKYLADSGKSKLHKNPLRNVGGDSGQTETGDLFYN